MEKWDLLKLFQEWRERMSDWCWNPKARKWPYTNTCTHIQYLPLKEPAAQIIQFLSVLNPLTQSLFIPVYSGLYSHHLVGNWNWKSQYSRAWNFKQPELFWALQLHCVHPLPQGSSSINLSWGLVTPISDIYPEWLWIRAVLWTILWSWHTRTVLGSETWVRITNEATTSSHP
jgi:hypothetical protein